MKHIFFLSIQPRLCVTSSVTLTSLVQYVVASDVGLFTVPH